MKKENLKFIFSLIGTALIVLGVGFLLLREKAPKQARAQENVGEGEWTCSVVIPEGVPLQMSSEILNGVYKEYIRAAGALETAISSGQLTAGALSEHPDVCNFAKCTAEGENISPDFVLGVKPLLFLDFLKFDGLAFRPPICAKKECVGDPCSLSVLRATIDEMKATQAALKMNYTNIRNIFTEPTETITYDLAIKEEDIGKGKKITKKDYVNQSIEWAQEELKSCGLTQAERVLVSEGKLSDRQEMLCLEALSSGYYTRPKPWSEKCEQECGAGLNDECVKCLRKCEGDSFLAKLNCEMYRLPEDTTCKAGEACCGKVCSEGFSPACETCLCDRQGLSKEQCLMKVCGGALENFMCCYK